MTKRDPGPDEYALRRKLGDELRAVIETLLSQRAPDEELADALELLRSARRHLAGPEEDPYGEAPALWDGGTHSGWQSYIDSSVFGGGVNPLGMPMELVIGTSDDGQPFAQGVVQLGRAYEGGPGMVHGGYVVGLLDHVFGCAMHGTLAPAVTATLTVRFVAPTPVHRDLRLRAWFEPPNGRRLIGRATCHDGDTLTAEAEGLFIGVDMAKMAERVRGEQTG